MTVIAAFSLRRSPVLFGDLLITEERAPSDGRHQPVPGVWDVSGFFARYGWSVSELRQKIALIDDDCALAWAGNFYAARQAISDLRAKLGTTKLAADEIITFLKQVPAVQKLGASFVGWVREGKGMCQFRVQAEDFNGDAYGTVYVVGTGAFAVREVIQGLNPRDLQATGEVGAGETVVSIGLVMAGILLSEEANGGAEASTLRNRFGGGYEIAAHLDGRFQKIGDMTFLLWDAEASRDGVKLSFPKLIVKQQYLNDVLLLRSARLSHAVNSNRLSVSDQQFHAVLPVYDIPDRISEGDLRKIPLHSRLLCHCFMVRAGDRVAAYTRVQQTAKNAEPAITFEDSDGEIVIGFNESFVTKVAESIHREFAGAAAQ